MLKKYPSVFNMNKGIVEESITGRWDVLGWLVCVCNDWDVFVMVGMCLQWLVCVCNGWDVFVMVGMSL